MPVFEYAHEGDRAYIVSEYIPGRTLDDLIEQEQPDFRRAAEIVCDLAEALAYAHREGVTHRDVKPSNVLINCAGEVFLTDFGLARVETPEELFAFLSGEDVAEAEMPAGQETAASAGSTLPDAAAAKLTRMGAALGTPAYMPPEQAAGNLAEVGPASDQYSLGVVLYELLCGDVPFSGPPELVVSLVKSQEVPSPRGIKPAIPTELERICLRATAKRPKDRYATCRQMADDLRCWLTGRPVHTGCPVALRQPNKKGRSSGGTTASLSNVFNTTKRKIAGAVGGMAFVATVAALASLAFPPSHPRPAPIIVAVRPKPDGKKPAVQPALSTESIVRVKPVPLDLKADTKAWDLKPGCPLNPASLVLKPSVIKGLRSWTLETCASRNSCWGGTGQLSPDDQMYAAVGRDGVVRFLDSATGNLRIALVNPELDLTALTWSPDNVYVAVGCRKGAVRIWNVANSALVIGPASSSTNQISSLAWSPDGTLLAIAHNGESAVVLWDVREARQSAVLQEPADANCSVNYVKWSADGKQLMATTDLAVRVWDVAGARLVRTLDPQDPQDHEGRRAAAWSPDGKRIATLCWNGKAKFFDSTCNLVMSGQMDYPYGFTPTSMAWSPDGRHLAGGWYGGCAVLNTESGAEDLSFEGIHVWGDESYGLSWSQDSARLFCTQNNSGTVTAIDIVSGKPLWQRAGNLHYGGTGICISPDGRQYATAICRDHLYTWDAMQCTPVHDYGPVFSNCDQVAWSNDGRLAVAGGAGCWGDPGGRVWDPQEPGPAQLCSDDGSRCAAWSPDGKTLARGGGGVFLLSADSDIPHQIPGTKADAEVAKLAWDADNSTLAAGLDNNKVVILEMPSGKVLRTLERAGLAGGIRYLGWLPDGRLVAASHNGTVSVWNSKWQTAGDLVRLGTDINDGTTPAGGTTTALATSDGLLLWDADKQVVQGKVGTGPTYSVAWSLPLHRLIAAQDDRLVIYDVPSNTLLAAQIIWWGPGKHLFISPEGHMRCSEKMSEDVVYVALTDDGREVTLRPAEFAAKYGWKNDPERIRLSSCAAANKSRPRQAEKPN